MCFGNSTTDTKSTNYTPNSTVAQGATSNMGFVQNLQNQGFTPFSGQQVANFGPLQSNSFDLGSATANNPTGQTAAGMINNYASAPAGNVNANTISSAMNPYMNQYVAQSLTPQLQMQDTQFAGQNKAVDAAATSAGAYGDTGWGQLRGTTTQSQDAARQGLIGQAYNSAFNTAIGAGAQDVSNNLNAQTTNAGLQEQMLGRQLGGANALQGLQNQQMGVAGQENQLGQQQTAQQQAQLNAGFNQWMMGQQYPFQTAQLMNQTVGNAARALPANSTTTDQKPDNSGYAMLGAIGGAVGNAFLPGIGGMVGSSLGNMAGGYLSNGSISGGQNVAMGQGGGVGFDANGNALSGSYADGGRPPPGQPAVVGERGPEVFVPDQPPKSATPAKPPDPRPFGWPPHIPGMFADGGAPPPKKPIVVGERGPEVFVPKSSGVVIPHEILAAIASMQKRGGLSSSMLAGR